MFVSDHKWMRIADQAIAPTFRRPQKLHQISARRFDCFQSASLLGSTQTIAGTDRLEEGALAGGVEHALLDGAAAAGDGVDEQDRVPQPVLVLVLPPVEVVPGLVPRELLPEVLHLQMESGWSGVGSVDGNFELPCESVTESVTSCSYEEMATDCDGNFLTSQHTAP